MTFTDENIVVAAKLRAAFNLVFNFQNTPKEIKQTMPLL
jgi:hypothetical protein